MTTPYPEGPYGGTAGSTQVGAAGDAGGPGIDIGSASVGQLVGQVTNDLSTLMRQEFALAKAELTEEAKKAATGAGALGAAGYLGHLTALLATTLLVVLLDLVMPLWAAVLIVTVVYAAIAFALFTTGKKKLKTVDPTPRQTVETLKEDVAWARHQTN